MVLPFTLFYFCGLVMQEMDMSTFITWYAFIMYYINIFSRHHRVEIQMHTVYCQLIIGARASGSFSQVCPSVHWRCPLKG